MTGEKVLLAGEKAGVLTEEVASMALMLITDKKTFYKTAILIYLHRNSNEIVV